MEDYRNFSPEELAADDSFRRWIIDNNPSDKQFWEKWLADNPDKKELIDRSAQFIEVTEFSLSQVIQEEEIQFEIERLSRHIQEKKRIKRINTLPVLYKFAAAIVLIMGIEILNTHSDHIILNETLYSDIIGRNTTSVIIENNQSTLPKFIILPDQSSVVLQPNSKLTYPTEFASSQRQVYLDGEAFFEISKNPSKPFLVYTHSVSTKVLGTSFTVKAYSHQPDTKVTVKTGKVSVFPSTQATLTTQNHNFSGETILTPNQQIFFNKEDKHFTKSEFIQSENTQLPILHQSFIFKDEPIHQVFEVLEKSYGIHIIFSTEIMQNCYLTASLSDEPLFEKLLLICRTIGADFQINANQITISSQGCY